jgi:hypothetical protein
MNLEGCSKKNFWPILKYYTNNHLEKLRKIMKDLSHDNFFFAMI